MASNHDKTLCKLPIAIDDDNIENSSEYREAYLNLKLDEILENRKQILNQPRYDLE